MLGNSSGRVRGGVLADLLHSRMQATCERHTGATRRRCATSVKAQSLVPVTPTSRTLQEAGPHAEKSSAPRADLRAHTNASHATSCGLALGGLQPDARRLPIIVMASNVPTELDYLRGIACNPKRHPTGVVDLHRPRQLAQLQFRPLPST